MSDANRIRVSSIVEIQKTKNERNSNKPRQGCFKEILKKEGR